MLKWVLQKIVGTKNQREIKRIRPIVDRINELEGALQSLSDEQIADKTKEWQRHLHRYLPIELPTKREIERLVEDDNLEELKKIAYYLQDRFDELREEFKSLPEVVAANAASIEEAKNAFFAIEDNFSGLRKAYLDRILPEAYAVVKNAARRLCGQKISVCDNELDWNMVHFDTQLIGGVALHRGVIAEMQTGEGKTLVGTLPVYLNALTGMGVHVVTVNDYLARRDSEWMGALYKYLGLTVGVIQNQLPAALRSQAYRADITYGTNSEFGFDYLRDNGMASTKGEQAQRSHYFAIIDEVDSVLIDEARTPLIISGPSTMAQNQNYDRFNSTVVQLVRKQMLMINGWTYDVKKAVELGDMEMVGKMLYKIKLGQPKNRQFMKFMEEPELRRAMEKAELRLLDTENRDELYETKEELYFTIDEKSHDSDLMEKGRVFLSPGDSEAFTLPDLASEFAEIEAKTDISNESKERAKEQVQNKLDFQALKVHAISQLLKAHCIYEKDVEYVVADGKVVIVDQNTGREMPGRRWSDGLHQAVEAKEGVKLEDETQTYATITIQNYFRQYEKLAGMTGTAETEAAEFKDIYGLDVLPIPTHRENKRFDRNDLVFKTRREKYNIVVEVIKQAHEKGQPVLAGTASVDASETLSKLLKRAKIPHNVLNAKYHRQEAEIISSAGQKGSVTVSTNMAGRGTDIKLGPGVEALGGLFVVATERHPSRRIDRQLRGRCARQGDAGTSQFFISFEDDLMRNFAAADRMTTMMEKLGLEDGEALEHSWLNKSVESAQKRVEQAHYRHRKYVLDFDNVMNQQREVIYGYRNEVLRSEDPSPLVLDVIEEGIPSKLQDFFQYDAPNQRPVNDVTEFLEWTNSTFPLGLTENSADFANMKLEEVSEFLIKKVKERYSEKMELEQPKLADHLERSIILVAIDSLWKEHLYNMDALREGVQLRAQGQKDPLVEYKKEAFTIFEVLMSEIQEKALTNLFRSTTNLDQYEAFLKGLPQQTSAPSLDGDVGVERKQVSNPLIETDEKTGKKKVKLNLPKRKPTLKIGRNEPCSCGSGKKFKRCCGR